MNNTITVLDLDTDYSTTATNCVIAAAQTPVGFGTGIDVSAHTGVQSTAKGSTDFSAALEIKISADHSADGSTSPGQNKSIDIWYGFLNSQITPADTANITNCLRKVNIKLNPKVDTSGTTETDTYYRVDIKKTGKYIYVGQSHAALDAPVKLLVSYTY
jgi:hypothetical protein